MRDELELALHLLPAWSKYVPHKPWPKQLAFCMLPHREALYGGAAGGGKSEALLMAALMYVDVPNYSAIIFRLSLTDLQQNEGLLSRALEWLSPWPEVKYVPHLHTFKFPSGARLTFGFMGNYTAWQHYQGASYQFIGWDELTQHQEYYYLEMMSRLRRVKCHKHGGREGGALPDDPNCVECLQYAGLSRVPLRVRSTSNPGGPGHLWVKKRFKIHRDRATGNWVSGVAHRPFIAATFLDNPALDQESYAQSLEELDEARRAQLKEGDWDKLSSGRYKQEWFREYSYHGGYYSLHLPGGSFKNYHEDELSVFCVVDVACSVRTGVAEESFYRHYQPSWTVIGTFGATPNGKLLVLDIVRFQEEAPHIFQAMRGVVGRWKPMFVAVDCVGPGRPIAQIAASHGIPVKEVDTRRVPGTWSFDKIANSAEAQAHAKAGRIFLPEDAPWLNDFLSELTCWTGHPHETDDQVDVLSNAGHEFTLLMGNLFRDPLMESHFTETPHCSPNLLQASLQEQIF